MRRCTLFTAALLILFVSLPAPAATVLQYDFEDGTPGEAINPTTAAGVGSIDISGNGNDMWGWASANQNNGPLFSQLGESFDGTGLSVFYNANKDGYTTSETVNTWSPAVWTIEISFNLTDVTGWRTMIGRDGSTNGDAESDFYLQTNGDTGQLRLNIENVEGTGLVIDSDFTLVANQWYHAALVSDGTTVTMYVDKLDGLGYQQVAQGTLPGATLAENALAQTNFVWTFGRGWHNGGHTDYIRGYLDDIRFSDAALTPDQFLHDTYDVGFPSPADKRENVAVSRTFSWQQVSANTTVESYDIYLSSDPNMVDPNDPTLVPTYTSTTPSVAVSGLAYSTVYYWRVDAIPTAGADPVKSKVWTFTSAGPEVVIDVQPKSMVANPDATFVIEAVNVESYAWYKQGDPTVLSTTDTLTVANAALADEGAYYCDVTGGGVTKASDTVYLWTPRLLGHWKFDGNMLDSVADTVAGAPAHDGVIGENTVAGSGDPNFVLDGINGGAIQFFNDGDYVAIPDSAFWNIHPAGFTVSLWYRQEASAGWRLAASKLDAGTAGWLIGVDSGRNDATFIVETGGSALNGDPDINTRDGQWHLLTTTYNPADTTLRFYTDGLYDGSKVINLANYALPEALLSIGGRSSESSVGGSIDDVRMYSYPLPAEDIAQMYLDFEDDGYLCLVPEGGASLGAVDLNGDCRVSLDDISLMAEWWLDCYRYPDSFCAE